MSFRLLSSAVIVALAVVALTSCQPNPDQYAKYSVRNELPVAVKVVILTPYSDQFSGPFIVNGPLKPGETRELYDKFRRFKEECLPVKSFEITDADTGKVVPVEPPTEVCEPQTHSAATTDHDPIARKEGSARKARDIASTAIHR